MKKTSLRTACRYITALYWASSTMATVGYGDVTPIQIPEKIVSMIGMLVGVTVFAYIMGTMSALLSTFSTHSQRIQDRQQQLDGFIRTHKIPQQLAVKLRQFCDYILKRQVHSEDLELINSLSGPLRQQVLTPVT